MDEEDNRKYIHKEAVNIISKALGNKGINNETLLTLVEDTIQRAVDRRIEQVLTGNRFNGIVDKAVHKHISKDGMKELLLKQAEVHATKIFHFMYPVGGGK